MRRRTKSKTRRRRVGTVGYLGMLVGVVSATVYVNAGSAVAPAPQEEPPKPAPKPFDPTVQIDVEQAVDFPWDI